MDSEGKVKATTFPSNENLEDDEVKAVLTAFDDRDTTVGTGLSICKQHYEVHRFNKDPDFVYGRRGDPGDGAGFAVHRLNNSKGKSIFFVITYLTPILSARVVPQLKTFAKKYVDSL